MSKILVIDGMFFIHRSANFVKQKYGVVYCFFRNLRAIIEKFEPDKVFFVLEGHPQFRYDLFSGYKSNRIKKYASKSEEKKEAFNEEIRIIIELLKHLPIQIIKAENYEADDVIGYLANDLKNDEVIIVSSDTDFIQLLQSDNKNIKLYNPIKKQYIEPPHYHYLLWKILRGDTSDNIPGIVSDEEAEELSINPSKLKTFLLSEENKANFNLNRELIEFKKLSSEDILFIDYIIDFNLLKEQFSKLKFETMIKEPYWNKFILTFGKLL